MKKNAALQMRRARGMKRSQRVKRNRLILLLIIILILVCIRVLTSNESSKSEQTKEFASIPEEQVSGEYMNAEGPILLNSNEIVPLQKDPLAEDVAFVEKYLEQQMLGDMPDGANGEKVAYLSFDDGPSTTVTPLILDILKKEDVRATFFVLGKAVDKNEDTKNLVRRIAAEGHAIGNHTYSHDYDYLYPGGKVNADHFMKEINKTKDSLQMVLGQDFSTRAVRFPGGRMTWQHKDPSGISVLDSMLQADGYHQVDWNTLPRDAEGAPKKAEALVEEFKKSVAGREKAVILMHDTYGKEETAKALPEILRYLKDHGFTFKTMR